ncbi:Phosphoglucosamine mutase [hydrothermal vent metagenome]|uniref:Phosphoglucosamine mutase n=1 Tax=hydrothermal vent metagenome TaxID=652676 RepID=A0A3B1AT54_9ZZZZ
MERKYFGTDGIRGQVGKGHITPDFILKLGWAAGRVLGKGGNNSVLIGKDTRISGYMFESALEAGLVAAGVNTRLLGPMPTPGIAYLTRTLHAQAGIVISASHNPHQDNGIKFFSGHGCKLPDETEWAIEQELSSKMVTVGSVNLGKASRVPDAPGRYIEFCKSTIPSVLNFRGFKLVVDCAHGATYHIAPHVFDELGAEVIAIGTEPDGLNINEGVGSTSPERLQETVQATGADMGIGLDGDGDRLVMVDDQGDLLDGDNLLYIIAKSRLENGGLRGPVVGTVMSNLGLELALDELGVDFERVNVGDRYILEQLQKNGGAIGGEPSGHIICLDRTTTGDGIIAALQVLAEVSKSGKTLRELSAKVEKCPQELINVPVTDKNAVMGSAVLKQAVAEVEAELKNAGRVLLRPSGTEPLIRVMIEGRDGGQVARLAEQLADVVRGV